MARTKALPKAPGQKAPQGIPAANVRIELAKADRLRRAGKLKRATAMCEAMLAQYPDYVAALHTLGLIHMETENYWAALSCFVRAAMLNPKDPTILINLGNVYFGLGAAEQSIQTLEQAKAFDPDNPVIHNTLGEIYLERREYELAVACLEKVLALDPAHAGAAYHLSGAYGHMGRNDDVIAVLKRAFKADPNAIDILGAIAQERTEVVPIDVLAAIDALDEGNVKPVKDFPIRVAFARATALHNRGRYEEAWDVLLNVNAVLFDRNKTAFEDHLRRREYNLKQAMERTVKPRRHSAESADVPGSLFILGPSRSGKTSLERLVGAVGGVRRGYENPIVRNSVLRSCQLSGFLSLNHLAGMPDTLDEKFTDIYVDELLERAAGAKVFTSTHPGRIPDVGRLAALVPRGRFVFVKRDVDDIALRIFMKHYRSGSNTYSYNVETTYAEIANYHRMIDIWVDKVPQSCLVVTYEDMIADPHATLSQVANLCGLAMPSGPLPELGDDRGCAAPYRDLLGAARAA